MHELSLMEAVREQAVAEARRHGACAIERISLRIGSLAGVDPEALALAFEVVMAGSPAAGAQLRIETVTARWFCAPCAAPFDGPTGLCLCPRCGAASGLLLQGRDLELTSLQIR
jgi:hydrogenase nickel incorporation protein HypA/HybF